jgi:hypothetical protein
VQKHSIARSEPASVLATLRAGKLVRAVLAFYANKKQTLRFVLAFYVNKKQGWGLQKH